MRDYQEKKQKKKSVKIGTYLVKVSYDKNGNPVFTAIGENSRTAVFTYEQALAKYYHADVYNLEFPKGFDVDYVRVLQPKERIAYIEQTVPPKKILEFLKANVNSFVTENFRTVPGFIGARKNPGQLYINRETGQSCTFEN